MKRTRGIYCGTCKQEKGPGCENDSRCKSCKSEYEKQRRIKKRIAQGKPECSPEREAYCEGCKEKKLAGISIRGRCSSCVIIFNRLRLNEKRAHEGMNLIRVRTLICQTCNIEKINGRCLPCNNKVKAANKAERRRKAREEKGLKQWGTGRQLTCGICGKIKENPKIYRCKTCQIVYDKERWATVGAPKFNQRPIVLECECGKQKTSTRKLYCEDCLLMRRRKASSESNKNRRRKAKKNGFIIRRIPMSDQDKALRKGARDYLHLMIRRGVVKRLNCEVCGSDENIEAHHDDYTKPLDVEWLCKIHHQEHHDKVNEEIDAHFIELIKHKDPK